MVFGTVGLGHENIDVLTNDIGSEVTEDAFGRGIYTLDDTALVNGDNSIDSVVDNRAQTLLAFAQRRLRVPHVCDVVNCQDNQALLAPVELPATDQNRAPADRSKRVFDFEIVEEMVPGKNILD